MRIIVMRVLTSFRETPGICRSPPLASATSSHVLGLAVGQPRLHLGDDSISRHLTAQGGRPIMPRASKSDGVADCKRCGDECGCAGGVKAGACGTGCQAGGCECAHREDVSPEVC